MKNFKRSINYLIFVMLLLNTNFVNGIICDSCGNCQIAGLYGDYNRDGVVDTTDCICINNYIWGGGTPPACLDDADVNGDSVIDVSDYSYLMTWLSFGGPAPVAGQICDEIPSTPGALSATTPACDGSLISYSPSLPPSDAYWYWQDTLCGTSWAMSASVYNATIVGINNYYLRAMHKVSTCWSLSCSSIQVEIIDSPVVNAGSDATIYSGNTHTISGSIATNYSSLSWSTSGDGTFTAGTTLTPTYTPGPNDISAGTVTLTIQANGNPPCGNATDSMKLTISTVGMKESATDNKINIYPNPSDGIFNLSIKGLNNTADLSIFNIHGQTIYKEIIEYSNNFNKQINLSNHTKGIYFLKLMGGDVVRVEKVVIQ